MTSSYDVIFSAHALEDLDGIYQHGVSNWGESQARSYVQEILTSIMLLSDFPRRGKAALDMPPGIRQIMVGKHRALSQVSARTVDILRVVSPRMVPPFDLET